MTTTEAKKAPTATTAGASQDTTRAEKSNAHLKDTLPGTVSASVIHWTRATVTTPRRRARGRPPDAEPPDVAASGGSPDTAPSSTSSGLGDASILRLSSTLDNPPRREVIHRATKAEERAARQAEATARRIGPAAWADNAWIAEVRAPSLVGPERLAVLREQAEYGDSWLSGGAS